LSKDAFVPGFEDGTAGVTYVFARLYSETNKARYLFAARQGALYLQSVAPPESDAAFISHPLSDLPEAQYSGFCQGPAGTARTFLELYKITREPTYRACAERMAQAILQCRFPDNLTSDYTNPVCQCCSSVAVIDFFIMMWASTGRLNYLASAQRAVHQLVCRGDCAENGDDGWATAVGSVFDNPCANKRPA
jgi:hypothetical protein